MTERDPDEPLEPDETETIEEGDNGVRADEPLAPDPTEPVPFGELVPDEQLDPAE